MASMKEFSDLGFYNDLRAHQISLTFQGMMSQELLALIGQSLRRKPDDEVISKRLFGLVVELAQNIYHYSAVKQFSEKDEREIGVGIIAVGESEDYYFVYSGNMVDSERVKEIAERCDHINSLDSEAIKHFYKEQRRMPQREDSPGANIGLIEIVRRSGNPIGYLIDHAENGLSFLTFMAKISKNAPLPVE